jgi:hypothetical protein
MTPKEQAQEIMNKFTVATWIKFDEIDKLTSIPDSKECALIAVQYIINANPHSNPFNTEVHSTMDWWIEVKQEIEKL